MPNFDNDNCAFLRKKLQSLLKLNVLRCSDECAVHFHINIGSYAYSLPAVPVPYFEIAVSVVDNIAVERSNVLKNTLFRKYSCRQ